MAHLGLLKPDPSIAGYRAIDMGLTPLYVSKLQHNILIFGLAMVEIWPAVYTSSLQPVYPITSRKILRQEFPSQM